MTKKNNELQEIFEDMNLDETVFTPEVMDKIVLIIESKTADKLEAEKTALEEANKVELSEFKDGLINQLDEYMNYFVEEFTKDNQKDIIDSVKVKTAERVLENFNAIVNDFNISLSEETVDQSDKISELETELNESVNQIIAYKKEIADYNKKSMIDVIVQGIDVESEKSKFTKIAESFEYTDDEEFTAKLNTLTESLELTEKETQDSEDTDTERLVEDIDNNEKIINTSTSDNPKSKYLQVLRSSAS